MNDKTRSIIIGLLFVVSNIITSQITTKMIIVKTERQQLEQVLDNVTKRYEIRRLAREEKISESKERDSQTLFEPFERDY